jgi:hypothetical protein
MSAIPPTLLRRPTDRLASDTEIVEQAAKLVRLTNGSRAEAKTALLAWGLVLACYERTTVSAVYDRLVQSAPSRHDQERLVTLLRARLLGDV